MTLQRQILSPVVTIIAVAALFGTAVHESRAGESYSSCKSSGTKAAAGSSCHTGQTAGVNAKPRNDPPFRAPHGGQLSKQLWNYFEVVYGAQETRIYLFDMFRYPVPAKGIQGRVIMRVRSNGQEFQYPVQHVPVRSGQDYLAIRVDLSHVRDGDMDVYYDLAGLPNQTDSTVRFSQVFAMPRLEQLPATGPSNSTRSQFVVTKATRADEATIQAQGICPVMNQRLGDHGTPTKIVVNGRSLFVCCEGCIDRVKKDPGLYLAKIQK